MPTEPDADAPQTSQALADARRANAALERALALPEAPPRLREAMRYATLGGGKRIRPRLVYATGRLAEAPPESLDAAAAAVELLHAYSLVHDDLPAMDDDALRRGRPSAHVAFDEATAILAGDALQALAFETLAAADSDPEVVRRQLRLFADAAGAAGMVGGQVLDMAGETRRLTIADVEATHRRKSGALIRAAILMGACGGALSARERHALGVFGGEIGLAFQIRDDVLDATRPTAARGKIQGADAARGKSTYPSLLGVAGATAAADERLRAALAALTVFGDRASELAAIARDIAGRRS